jgi:DNA-binding Lrp family transcriptional regulator
MAMSNELDIINELKRRIIQIIPVQELKIQVESQLGPARPDFIAEVAFKDWRFKLVGEIVSGGSSLLFEDKLSQLRLYVERNPEIVPIMVAKYLSPLKRDECKKAGVCFLDLSGNVFLNYEGIYIERIGFPNLFPEKRKGRKPFSDKASLILRAMLLKDKLWGVRELAELVNLDPGYVSRMIRELEKLNYLVRANAKVKLRDPKAVLEDWVGQYDYRKNEERKYFCVARSPDEILSKLKDLNIPEQIDYALGFHAGAYLVSPHAVFNEVHIYVSNQESIDLFVKQLNSRPVEQGANIILLSPYYKHSVFYGKQKIEGLWVVSGLQLYLDLYKYPLRGLEQAEHLYEIRLKKFIESRCL